MQKTNLKARGLFTFPNQISGEAPAGSLSEANNVIIDREGVLEPRRGFNTLPGTFGIAAPILDVSNQIFRYANSVLTHYGPMTAPDTIAFYAPTSTITGKQTTASNIITNLNSVADLYVGQYITVETIEQAFTGNIVLGSAALTNVLTTTGLFVGQLVGGLGILANTTIVSITGSGPFTVNLSANSTYTKTNAAFNATNRNILGFVSGTKITNVGSTTITLSNSATTTSRILTFLPADVDVSGNLINYNINGLVNGQTVQFTTTGGLPAGLSASNIYYVINSNDTLFQVSTSLNGSAVDITGQGTGTHSLHVRNYINCYGWIDYTGTYLKPSDDVKIRSVEANNNVYFTTSLGVQKLDNLTSAIVPSGAPKGLDGFAALDPAISGFMPDDVQVAYRVVWGYKDLNKNLILGAPSQRIVIANTSGGTKDVDLNITIPQEVTTNYFYQVYRSGFSATANDEPNDEMALVYEANPTATDLTNGYVIVVDQTPESLRNGAALYTSPSQEGILQANEPPPFAKDVALFKGSVFYANTQTKQNLTLSILAASGQFQALGVTNSINTPTTVRHVEFTGDLTVNSDVIINIPSTALLSIGQELTNLNHPTYLPNNTVITNILGLTSVQINTRATSTVVGDTFVVGMPGVNIGQMISGTGIPSSTIVENVYTSFLTLGDTHSNTLIDNISPTNLFEVGQIITGTDIPANTTITSITPANPPTTTTMSITISNAATGTTVGAPLVLHDGFQISNAATVSGTPTLTLQNGTNGIQIGDTITIAGTTFTAATTENIAAKQFQVFAQGSPAQNIADTAKSLAKVINRTGSPTPTIYAYYLSGYQDLPGKLFFQERVFGGGVFSATANSDAAGEAYNPNLPASGTSVSSQNDQFSNGLYFSKTQQPEAVPLLNFTKVGSAQAAILRIIALRDSLFILKEDGVYRLTGSGPSNFSVDLFDSTTQILSAESAVSLNNLIFMLSKYGIVTISDTGGTVISRAIEDKMLDLFEVDLDKAKSLSFGISYESDRKYIFFCVTNADDQYATQAYVYNTFTTTWTRWVRNQTCGIVHPKFDLLYLGESALNVFDIERKSRNYTDYMDGTLSVNLQTVTGTTTFGSSNITGVTNSSYFEINQPISGIGIAVNAKIISIPDGSTLTINSPCTSSGTTTILQDAGKTLIVSPLTNIEIGDVLWQTNGRYSIITDINTDVGTLTVRDFINDWILGESIILKAFESKVKYVPQTAQNPGTLKQFRETTLLFQVPFFNILNIGFDTDLSSGTDFVPLQGLYGTQWGRFPWGQIPFGGTSKPLPIRTYPPQQKQRCSLMNITLKHREAYAYYRLNGASFIHNNLSERVGK